MFVTCLATHIRLAAAHRCLRRFHKRNALLLANSTKPANHIHATAISFRLLKMPHFCWTPLPHAQSTLISSSILVIIVTCSSNKYFSKCLMAQRSDLHIVFILIVVVVDRVRFQRYRCELVQKSGKSFQMGRHCTWCWYEKW